MKTMTIGMFGLLVQYSLAAGPGPAATPLSLPIAFEANQGQSDSSVKFLAHDPSGSGSALFLTEDGAILQAGRARHASVRMKIAGARKARISGADPLAGKANYFIGADPSRWIAGAPTYRKVAYQQIYSGIDLLFYGSQRQLEYDFVVAPGADAGQIALEFSGAKPRLDSAGNLEMKLNGRVMRFRKPTVYQSLAGEKKIVAGAYRLHGGRVRFELGAYDHSRELVIDPVLEYLTYLGAPSPGSSGTYIGFWECTAALPGCPTTVGQGVAVDPSGNLYIAGDTFSTSFPLQNAADSKNTATPNDGGTTVFVAKLNPSGSELLYSTYLGGSKRDNVAAIAIDAAGAAYLTGGTQSPDFPITAGAYQNICSPRGYGASLIGICTSSVFVSKLSSTGSLVYSTFIGGTNGSMGAAIAVDSQGRAYVGGQSFDNCDPINNHCFPTSANALIPGTIFSSTTNNQGNPGSGFVAVFDAAGANLLYGSLYGDTNPVNTNSQIFPTNVTGIALDPAGNFYLTGSTHDPRIPVTAEAYETNLETNGTNQERGYVAKFSPVGSGSGPSLVYSTYFGGNTATAAALTDVELVGGIAVDGSGNAYITGLTNDPDFPVTSGANQTNECGSAYECSNFAFLAKLNPEGSGLVWSTLVGAPPAGSSGLGGTVTEIAAPRVDAEGYVYISGQADVTGTPNFPLVDPLQALAGTGGQGVFVTEYDPAGSTVVFSTIVYTPTSGTPVFPGGMDVDSQGNIYIGGYTTGADLPTTQGAFQSAKCSGCTGISSGFLAKISTAPVITGVVNGASFQPGIESGSWATIEGVNLSNTNPGRIWKASEIVNENLPTSLDSTSVTIDGKPAFVYCISPTQLNVQVPTDANTGSVNVLVTNHGQTSAPFSAQLAGATPAFFLYTGTTYAIASRLPDYALLADPNAIPGTVAAKPGDILVLWATGFGPTNPPDTAGVVVTGAPAVTTLPTVTVGGAPVTVISAVLSPGSVGLYQVAIQLPASVPTGMVAVQASVGKAMSPTGVFLFVSAQ